MPDELDLPDRDPDRRREPDVFSYRLGAVEKQSSRNEEEISKLTAIVGEQVASGPSRYASRGEFDRLVDRLNVLSSDLQTFIATANASNAIRERNQSEQQTLRLQWPVWAFMGLTFLVALLNLLGVGVHHG